MTKKDWKIVEPLVACAALAKSPNADELVEHLDERACPAPISSALVVLAHVSILSQPHL